MSVATLSLFRFDGALSLPWVIGQMALARLPLKADHRLRFFKLCGSGSGVGFSIRPNWKVWAIMAAWEDEATARAATQAGPDASDQTSPVWRRWQARAAESCTIYLQPIAARGSWGGVNPFLPQGSNDPAAVAQSGPVAALTRATVKAQHAVRFWKQVPNISTVVGQDPNVIFKIGIGEVPLVHQVTFSVWPDTATMADFARVDGPHARAIRAVRDGQWFSEELYARFAVLGASGTWAGRDPLPVSTHPTARAQDERHAA